MSNLNKTCRDKVKDEFLKALVKIPSDITKIILAGCVLLILSLTPLGNWLRCNFLDTSGCLPLFTIKSEFNEVVDRETYTNSASNKTYIACNLLVYLLMLISLANTTWAEEMYVSYSPSLAYALPEIVRTIKELPKTRIEDCNVDFKIYKDSPITLENAKSEIKNGKLHLMIVLSSEIENQRKILIDLQDRKRESILVSFIAITTTTYENNKVFVSKVINNESQPFLYYLGDETLKNMINDIIRGCAQREGQNNFVVKQSRFVYDDVNSFAGILVKKIHFNGELIGESLFGGYEGYNKPLSTFPIEDSNDDAYVQCVTGLTSKFWKEKIPYNIVTPGKIKNSYNGYEYFRDYSFIENLGLEKDQLTPVVEKVEYVVLLSHESKPEADRIIDEFNKCLYDRYYNLEGECDTARHRAKEPGASKKMKVAASIAKCRLEEFVKGFYLLLTDSFPTASYSRLFLLPDKTKYYSRIGNKYTRRELTEKLSNNVHLDDNELEALNDSIEKYKKYLEFRKEATNKENYDWWLLYAMERFAELNKIEFDHSYVKKENGLKSRLQKVIEGFRELHKINANILANSQKYNDIIESETNDFYDFQKRIKRRLEKLEKQL